MENKEERNKQIIQERETGLSYAEIARIHSLSLERIRQIVKESDEKKRIEKEHPGMSKFSRGLRNLLYRKGVKSKTDFVELLNSGEKINSRGIGNKTIERVSKVWDIPAEEVKKVLIGWNI